MTARLEIERLLVVLKRQLKLRVTYRMTAALTVVSAIAGLFSYGFLGNTAVVSATTQTYGMSLASFLVSGVAFGSIVNNGLTLFYDYIGPSQIEEVMVTPTDFREYILMSSLLSILASIGSSALLFSLSTLLFGLSYSYNLPVLLAMILLGILSSIGLGFIGLAFQMVYKQTQVLSWLLYSLTGITGNMLVPVQILPAALQTVSYLTPQYYFFTGIRSALGSNVAPVGELLTTFTIYTAALLILGHLALNRSLEIVRRRGTHRWI